MVEEGKNIYFILGESMYGMGQVAMQYSKKVIQILKEEGFIEGNVNPCICMKKVKKG